MADEISLNELLFQQNEWSLFMIWERHIIASINYVMWKRFDIYLRENVKIVIINTLRGGSKPSLS